MTLKRLFLAVFSCLLAVIVAQNLATPRNAGPDETAHIARGAGLVRGELRGQQYAEWEAEHGDAQRGAGAPDPNIVDAEATRVFDVPRWIAQPPPSCYAFRPDMPAGCSTISDVSGQGVVSTAGSYPIWGQVLPGLSTLLVDSPKALWLARFLHGLIPTVLIAATLSHLLAQRRRTAASAVLVAITPMVLFMIAVVNPSGIVLAGSVALWVSADDFLRTGQGPSWLLPAGFAALVLPRNDGLLWAALTFAVLLLVWRRNPLALWRALPNTTRVALAAVSLLGAVWAVFAGGDLVPVGRPTGRVEFVEAVIAGTGRHLREAVGVLGWLDTPIPESMFALWYFAAGLVVMVALVTDARRRVVGAAVALALFVATSWGLEIVLGRTAGLFWQGRYALPLLMGVVLVPGLAEGADRNIGRIAAFAPGLLALVVWNGSFFQQARRWGVGQNGPIRPWEWDTWGAPLPVLLLLGVHVAGSVGLGWLCWTHASERHQRQTAATQPMVDHMPALS